MTYISVFIFFIIGVIGMKFPEKLVHEVYNEKDINRVRITCKIFTILAIVIIIIKIIAEIV